MSRSALTLLFVAALAATAAAEDAPPGRMTEITGLLDVPPKTDDEFVLRVLTTWGSGIAEILAEAPITRGSFRVKFPVPDREYVAVVTSLHHQPMIRTFRAGQVQPRFKKPIVPRGWKAVAVKVTDPLGRPVADVAVASRFLPNKLLAYPRLPWLEFGLRTPSDGLCRVLRGDDGRLTISTGHGRERSWEIRGDLPSLSLVHRPAPGALFLRAKLWPGDRRPDPTHLEVEYRVAGEWKPAPPRPSADGGVPTLEGWTAVRISYPRHRPFVLLRGDRPGVTHVECRLHAEENVRMDGSTLEVVPLGLARPDTLFPICGTSARWGARSPYRMELLDATGQRRDRELLNHRSGRGLPAGTWTLRVRGRLGRPVTRRVVVPAECAVRVPVDVTGGSGIRLLARNDGGRLVESVSFRVVDGGGRAVEVEYTDAAPRGLPAFAHEGRRHVNVPSGGLIRLDPGEWRVEMLDGENVTEAHLVRAWPNTVTRLDTRVRRAERGAPPRKGVRLR